MPEYLAPGVYVEEVDTGSKPIEGVSTSTAGMVGVTERGPVDVPILVTSNGEYERWFGGKLSRQAFDAARGLCYLPDAAEGFFSNRGKRLWVTRVVPEEAERSTLRLFGPLTDPVATTVLLDNVSAAATKLKVADPLSAAKDAWVRLGSGSQSEYLQLTAPATADAPKPNRRLTLTTPAKAPFPDGAVVRVGTAGFTLDPAANAGDQTITLKPATPALRPGQEIILEPGAANTESVRIDSTGLANRVTLTDTLVFAHAAGASAAPIEVRTLVGNHGAGSLSLILDSAVDALGSPATVTAPDGTVEVLNPGGMGPLKVVEVSAVPTRAHASGEAVAIVRPLVDVVALDQGAWGDRLRVMSSPEDPALVNRAAITKLIDATTLEIASTMGVESGTLLQLEFGPSASQTVVAYVQVVSVDPQTNRIKLAVALTVTQVAVVTANLATAVASSLDFRLDIELLHQPDATRPSRNSQVIARESFRHLSMDPRHSRYLERVVGSTTSPIRPSDRRPQGDSWYVRVDDRRGPVDRLAPSVGPDWLVNVLPNGTTRSAHRGLAGGSDQQALMNAAMYLGADADPPEDRKGLWSMVNVDSVSLLAIPGQTAVQVQQAVINQCEAMRYRFAVLDSPGPSNDTLSDVQKLRQNYDTKYAAMYYPWLHIPEVFALSASLVDVEAIPPSGHVLGIYARTDIERGVHKAPANEVIRNITGLRRVINKGEQEILNPFPTNINVLRDFRRDNRGLRVWGARVLTSDPDWKYVPVRRLTIFIEKSVDVGLQWVVFEPNSEILWARVRHSVMSFLTTVWRNGALEGVKREEAFFVKCDRTTMTQAQIDSGQLIIEIGIAPVKPAEFVIARIGLWTAHADD